MICTKAGTLYVQFPNLFLKHHGSPTCHYCLREQMEGGKVAFIPIDIMFPIECCIGDNQDG